MVTKHNLHCARQVTCKTLYVSFWLLCNYLIRKLWTLLFVPRLATLWVVGWRREAVRRQLRYLCMTRVQPPCPLSSPLSTPSAGMEEEMVYIEWSHDTGLGRSTIGHCQGLYQWTFVFVIMWSLSLPPSLPPFLPLHHPFTFRLVTKGRSYIFNAASSAKRVRVIEWESTCSLHQRVNEWVHQSVCGCVWESLRLWSSLWKFKALLQILLYRLSGYQSWRS